MVIETCVIWTAMILGGAGRTVGVIAGAVALQGLFTSTRFVEQLTDLPSDLVANLQLALVGLVLEMKVFNADSEEHAQRIAKSEIGGALRDVPLEIVETIEYEEDEDIELGSGEE